MTSGAIEPGATLGVMGGGQLGRMFVHAAQQMGYFAAVLDPDAAGPAGLRSKSTRLNSSHPRLSRMPSSA